MPKWANRLYHLIEVGGHTDHDGIQGNYLLATHDVVRRLRGQIFETTIATSNSWMNIKSLLRLCALL